MDKQFLNALRETLKFPGGAPIPSGHTNPLGEPFMRMNFKAMESYGADNVASQASVANNVALIQMLESEEKYLQAQFKSYYKQHMQVMRVCWVREQV